MALVSLKFFSRSSRCSGYNDLVLPLVTCGSEDNSRYWWKVGRALR